MRFDYTLPEICETKIACAYFRLRKAITLSLRPPSILPFESYQIVGDLLRCISYRMITGARLVENNGRSVPSRAK